MPYICNAAITSSSYEQGADVDLGRNLFDFKGEY